MERPVHGIVRKAYRTTVSPTTSRPKTLGFTDLVALRSSGSLPKAHSREVTVRQREKLQKVFTVLSGCNTARDVEMGLRWGRSQDLFSEILDAACLYIALQRLAHATASTLSPNTPSTTGDATSPGAPCAADSELVEKSSALGDAGGVDRKEPKDEAMPAAVRSLLIDSFASQGDSLGRHFAEAVWYAGLLGLFEIVRRSDVFLSGLGTAELLTPAELVKIALACALTSETAPLMHVALEVELRSPALPSRELTILLRCLSRMRVDHLPAYVSAAASLWTRADLPWHEAVDSMLSFVAMRQWAAVEAGAECLALRDLGSCPDAVLVALHYALVRMFLDRGSDGVVHPCALAVQSEFVSAQERVASLSPGGLLRLLWGVLSVPKTESSARIVACVEARAQSDACQFASTLELLHQLAPE
ncbi:hypothetical protein DIPPA_31325 [Diplonema papillatum]|nr:hypothetical protein DIPPA_31325 [Diplonema papillatum]